MSDARVTDIPTDSAPTTTGVLASQLQLVQTFMLVGYMLVECNCNQLACCF